MLYKLSAKASKSPSQTS